MIKIISDFLAKIFIKNSNAVQLPSVRSQYGILEGWLSIVINFLLGGIKLVLATISGSISLFADAFHSFSDMFTSFIVIISFLFSRKPSDQEHPFGHGRIEQIAALVMAVLIGVAGFELIKIGIDRVTEPQSVAIDLFVVSTLIATIIIKEVLGRISQYYGKKIESMALEAESWHHRTDAISSILVIIAIFASQFGFFIADGIGGIVIGIIVIYAGVDIAKRTSQHLLGTRPSRELEEKVGNLVFQTENVLAIHDMICHEYGPQKVISFHLEVPNNLRLSEAHTIAEKIEHSIQENLQIQATIHLDPVLPVISFKAEIEEILDDFIAENDGLIKYSNLRQIGEESFSTIVLDILTQKSFSESRIEALTNTLKEKIKRKINNLHDISINFINLIDS